MKISEIKPNPENPRVIKDDKYQKLVKSINEFPKMMELRPMVIDSNNIVLGGNMRLRALQELGYKELPESWVKKADQLTEEEKQRFIIVDNVGFGEWAWEVLKSEWDEEKLTDWGLDVPDFSEGNNHNEWKVDQSRMEGETDGVIESLGYNASSIWKDMPRIVDGITEKLIELPLVQGNTTRGTIVKEGGKYSRTIPEEIRRVVVTYMEKGDFFLENCCGWSTFGAIAKIHGYSGIGVDIWDVALKLSKRQIQNIHSSGNEVEILEADGMNLPFEDNKFDYVYCNPPFMDAELYSGKDNDIASSKIDVFRANLTSLLRESIRVLKPKKLCTMTISDVRRGGVVLSMANEMLNCAYSVGFKLHDFVIAENIGIANMMRKKAVEKKRCAKNHEYVITFVK